MSDELDLLPVEPESIKLPADERLGRWLIGPLATLFLVILLVFYVLFSPHQVVGDSMEPTLHNGDRTLVTHGYSKPRAGDIIVFKTINELNRPEDLVKRVIAVPGDTIEVVGGVATVNGAVENTTSYYPDPTDQVIIKSMVVPAGQLFVMGDNRPVSLDSRRIGFVPLGSAVGRVFAVWAPMGDARIIH